ncbi:MAG: hypothetical protein AAB414_03370 [Patescibacteria group bacterium]
METLTQPEDPQVSWETQKDHLIKLKFHEYLNMTEEEYRASLPDYQPQPEQFKGRFNKPILVDPRLRLLIQFIRYQVGGYATAIRKDTAKTKRLEELNPIQHQPYQIWVDEGLKLQGLSEDDAIKNFADDERGLNIIEGLALIREDHSLLNEHTVDLSGSREVIRLPSGGTIENAPRFHKKPTLHHSNYQLTLHMVSPRFAAAKSIFPTCGVPKVT